MNYSKLPNIDKLKFRIGIMLDGLVKKQKRYGEIIRELHEIEFLKTLGIKEIENESLLRCEAKKQSIFLRKGGSDQEVFKQIFLYKQYDALLDFFAINEIDLTLTIDAGSNIGLMALKTKEFFPNAEIYCIEPDPANFELLRVNTSNYEGIHLLQKALWYKDEKLYLNCDFADGQEWARSVSKEKTSETTVQGTTLQSLINLYNLHRIDLLKIDIEGSESYIFDTHNDLRFLEIVKIIAIEIHDEMNCRDRIYRILREKGFVLINSSELTIGINKSLLN